MSQYYRRRRGTTSKIRVGSLGFALKKKSKLKNILIRFSAEAAPLPSLLMEKALGLDKIFIHPFQPVFQSIKYTAPIALLSQY